MVVLLTPEPVALPGEQPQGQGLGAGQPIAPSPRPAVVAPAAPGPVVAESAPAPEPAPVPGPAPFAPTGPVALAAEPRAALFTPPAFIARVEPAYPERARRAGVEPDPDGGDAFDAVGAVLAVELLRTSGSRLLDDAALAAARASRFAPASRDEAPVASEALATYRFELR